MNQVCYAALTMRPSVTVTLGAFLVLAVGALLWRGGATVPAATSRDGGAPVLELQPLAAADAGVLDDPFLARLTNAPDAGRDEDTQDDAARPLLPAGSPKYVRFGVILVQYRGAQGAPPSMRSRDEAAVQARAMADAARTDFKAQVGQGDPGSLEDAGRIPRGVLEGPIEYALFTMAKGMVSDPIDTPRGFWIVKRID